MFGEEDTDSVYFSLTPSDSIYRHVFIYLDTLGISNKEHAYSEFLWIPAIEADTGRVSVDFIRFLGEKITLHTEGGQTQIEGLGGNLQIYALELPGNDSPDVSWSVEPEGIATISETGLLTALESGVARVTARMNDKTGSHASLNVFLNDTSRQSAWEFTFNEQGWNSNIHSGSVIQKEEQLVFTVEGPDPYVYNNLSAWEVGEFKYLWMKVLNQTAGTSGAFYFFPSTGSHGFVAYPLSPNDTEFSDVFVDMTESNVWKPGTTMNSLRLDPNNDGSAGEIRYDFIRFMKDLIVITSENGKFEIRGVGNSLQLRAEVLIDEYGKSVRWSSENPDIVSVNESGLLEAKVAGKARIIVVAVDKADITGFIEISVLDESTFLAYSAIEERVFPNPSSGTVYLPDWEKINRVEVFRSDGKRVYTVITSGKEKSIDIAFLSSGCYLLRLEKAGDRPLSYTIVKQ